MTQTNANLTWTKNEAGEHVSNGQVFIIIRKSGYYELHGIDYDGKINKTRMNLTQCKELAETKYREECTGNVSTAELEAAYDAACPDMPAIHAAPAFKPFLTEAENESIDHALSHTMPEADCLSIEQVRAELDAKQQEELRLVIWKNSIAAGTADRIGGPDNTLAAQTERDVAAMDADGEFIKPEYQMAAESRKKKSAAPLTIDIKGLTYPMLCGTDASGKATVNLTSPRGDTYGCVLDGKDSKCSCPSFEHRAWCKHLDALVGERNAVFGVDAKPSDQSNFCEPGGLVDKLQAAVDAVSHPEPIRNAVNVPMPRPMPAAESRKKIERVHAGGGIMVDIIESRAKKGKPLTETLFPDDDSEDIVRDEEPKGRGGRKGKRSNTETAQDSTPAIITPSIAENQPTAENPAKPQVPAPDAVAAKPDALPAPQKAKPAKVFTAALENLRPGTKFRQGRFRGELIDVNAGDAKVSVREGDAPTQVVHWSPGTIVRVGEPDETVEIEANSTAIENENVIIVGGVVSENTVSSGGSAMKVQRAEYELVLSELGLPAAKLAKMSLKDLGSKLGKLPDKASGRTIENEKAAKTLKGLLKAIEDGEEVEIVGEEKAKKTAKEGKGKAPKASANGNGHAKNGKAENGKAEKGTKAKEGDGGVGKDAFGSRLGSAFAAANAVLGKKPKKMADIVTESGIKDTVYNHMNKLVEAGFVSKSKEGYALAK